MPSATRRFRGALPVSTTFAGLLTLPGEMEVAADVSSVLYAYTIGATIEEQAIRQTAGWRELDGGSMR